MAARPAPVVPAVKEEEKEDDDDDNDGGVDCDNDGYDVDDN